MAFQTTRRMKLKLTPAHSTKEVQISALTVDGEFLCHILEDPVREVKGVPVRDWKFFGNSAIPAGSYKISLSFSRRFKKVLPILEEVPGFTGIRIHPGNTVHDTLGCLIPGEWRGGDSVSESRKAFAALVLRLDSAFKRGEEVTIEVNR